MGLSWGAFCSFFFFPPDEKLRFRRESWINPSNEGHQRPYEVFVVTMSPKKPPKMSVLSWNSSKNSNFRISEFYFSDFSKKKKTKQVSTRMMPTKPGQNSTKLRWDDRSIDMKETSNDHIFLIIIIDFIITTIIYTYGDDLRNSDNIITIRNITADSPPSWQSFWSRPLMANLGKSTTLAMWETTPHWLQVATPYWGWVGDGKADETFNPWVVGRRTSTTG